MIVAPTAGTAGVAGAKVQKSKASAVAVAAAAALTGSHHRHVVAAPGQAARQLVRIPPVVVEAGRACGEEEVAAGRNDEKHMTRRRKKGENMELDGEEGKENVVAVNNSVTVAPPEISAADVKRPQTKRKVTIEKEAAKNEFEESEDESERDINMVSEYSKEIFEYMKELEVSCSTLI